jgi:hypothetical protein
MAEGRHRGNRANEHFTVGSNSYEKVETCKYLDSLLTNQNSIHEKVDVHLKQEIHVIIQSKHFCLLHF